MSDDLVIAGKHFKSRLILGTGRYRTMEDMVAAVEASGTEMITVAIRRLDLDDPTKKTILDYIDWNKYQILPNTAGCATVEEALFIARLGREVGRTDFVKLEVIPDAKYLGLRSIDYERCGLSSSVQIALNDNDKKRAKQIAKYPWFEKKRQWQREIDTMLKNDFKLEVEALLSKDISYVTEEYVPARLKDRDWLD